ncbi:hypothetical protein P7C73_g5456, partial [Tremellales sp. Uapishka_1]
MAQPQRCPSCKEGVLTLTEGFMACDVCFRIDEAATDKSRYVDVTISRGAVVNRDETLEVHESYSSWREVEFMKHLDRLLDVFLVDPATCITRMPCPHFKAGAKRWYLRIRQKDAEAHGWKNLSISKEARKLPYQVAIAIRITVQENSTQVLKNVLEDSGHIITGGTRGDGRVPTPTHEDILARTRTLTGIGFMDSFRYLGDLETTYMRLLKVSFSAYEFMIVQFCALGRYLETMTKLPHLERLEKLRTIPEKKDWLEDTFDYLSKVDWKEFMRVGRELYFAQQCVNLWGGRSQTAIAVGLAITTIESITKDVMPQMASIQVELASLSDEGSRWTAAERNVELNNMILAWSTTLPDIGIPVPQIKKPSRGGVGDGLTYYGSDARRGIPDRVMVAAVGLAVANNWRAIANHRLKNRPQVMPFVREYIMAARSFAAAVPKLRRTRGPNKPKGIRIPVGNASGSTTPATASTPETTAQSVTVARPSASPTPVESVYSQISEAIALPDASPFFHGPHLPSPMQQRPIITRSSSPFPHDEFAVSQQRSYDFSELEKRDCAPADTIDAMLATAEKSSDEDYDMDSDEDGSFSGPRWRIQTGGQGLGLMNVQSPAGSALGFTIGPTGFSIEAAPSSLTLPQADPLDYASDVSQISQSAGLERSFSSESYSAFETEPPSRRGRLNPSSRGTSAAPSTQQARTSSSSRAISAAPSPQQARHDSSSRASSATPSTVDLPTPTMPPDILSSTTVIDLNLPGKPKKLKFLPRNPHIKAGTLRHSYRPAPDPVRTSASPRPPQTPPSPLLNVTYHLPPVDVSRSHIGMLAREKNQYITYRPSRDRVSGRIVSEDVEKAMLAWVKMKQDSGSMPKVISDEYLRSIGINTNPHDMDLGPYVRARMDKESPIATLLRVGIQPVEIPPIYVPHSLVYLEQQLYHYKEEYLAPPGKVLSEAELDDEMATLFDGGPEHVSDLFLSSSERAQRERQYLVEKAWDSPGRTDGSNTLLKRFAKSLDVEDDDLDVGERIQDAIIERIREARPSPVGSNATLSPMPVHSSQPLMPKGRSSKYGVRMPLLWDEDDQVGLGFESGEEEEDENRGEGEASKENAPGRRKRTRATKNGGGEVLPGPGKAKAVKGGKKRGKADTEEAEGEGGTRKKAKGVKGKAKAVVVEVEPDYDEEAYDGEAYDEEEYGGYGEEGMWEGDSWVT